MLRAAIWVFTVPGRTPKATIYDTLGRPWFRSWAPRAKAPRQRIASTQDPERNSGYPVGSNEENLAAAPAFPFLVPEVVNVRPGAGHSSCEIESEAPKIQRQSGGCAQIRYMDLAPAMRNLQFRGAQAVVDLLATPLQSQQAAQLNCDRWLVLERLWSPARSQRYSCRADRVQ